jgi:hypothetical protein
MLTRRALIAAFAACAVLAAGPLRAGSIDVFATDGVAINGYDPVAYFTEGAPRQGRADLSLKWKGAMWRFASEANRAAFEMNPRRYAPAYGGYCAYAMTQGAIATTVPEAWTIHEGRLYLNFSTGVRTIWAGDIPGNVVKADGHWPAALKK